MLIRKNKLKKAAGIALLLGSIMLQGVVLGGCGKESVYQVPIEDADNLNMNTSSYLSRIMKGEKGYYYCGPSWGTGLDIHYYDEDSKQNIFLCSKPECLHQGDEFCTATSDIYCNSGCVYYGDKIYFVVADNSIENHEQIKLLRIEPDGSGLTEVMLLKDVNLAGKNEEHTYFTYDKNMIIHRGILMASYTYILESKVIRGSVIYNLIDGTLIEMPEFSFEVDSTTYSIEIGEERNRFMGQGKYIYYNETRPAKRPKTYLCRYNIEDGTFEEAELISTYKGLYTVWKDDVTAYMDTFGNMCSYDWKEKKARKGNKISVSIANSYDENGELMRETYTEWPFTKESELICIDGKVVILNQYVPPFADGMYISAYHGDLGIDRGLRAAVLDDNLEKEQEIWLENMYRALLQDRSVQMCLNGNYYCQAQCAIVGDQWYLETDRDVYVCPVRDVIEQVGEFKHLYSKEARYYPPAEELSSDLLGVEVMRPVIFVEE